MNNSDYERLNGRQLLHTVWVRREDGVIGLCDVTIAELPGYLTRYEVLRIDCQGYTLESKIREIDRWGD